MLYGMLLVWLGLLYWARKPMFVPRFIAVEAGKADSLITATDKKVGLGFAVGTIAIVAVSMASTNEKYPYYNSFASWFVAWYEIN